MKIALRVDVDTFRGTRTGVPNLMRIMDKHNVRASFFFSVGPDNMGRHLWRLLKPKFLWKMLRTNAVSLYGPDIIFMGAFWPGPMIGKNNQNILRDCANSGHEIGLHAWDHQYWQSHIDTMSSALIYEHLSKACEVIAEYAGKTPVCSAVPGWKCTEETLIEKEKFHFMYNSDCRGSSVFMPVVAGRRLTTPQVPLSMPTYDEVLGRDGITNENYNERILDYASEDQDNVLTIHAEVEGGICAGMFDKFLDLAQSRGIKFVLPSQLIPGNVNTVPDGKIVSGNIPGREGWLALQQN